MIKFYKTTLTIQVELKIDCDDEVWVDSLNKRAELLDAVSKLLQKPLAKTEGGELKAVSWGNNALVEISWDEAMLARSEPHQASG